MLIGRMIHGSRVRRVSGIGWIQDREAGNLAPACHATRTAVTYVAMTAIDTRMLDRELKKGSAELIILSIVEPRARHGYEISKLIETLSAGQLKFHVASLYPLLYRLEERGWLQR